MPAHAKLRMPHTRRRTTDDEMPSLGCRDGGRSACRIAFLTSFSTSSRRAPPGPKARRHHRAGRLPSTPLRCAPGAALGLARTCQQGAGSKTAELAINDRHPADVVLAETAGCPPPAVDACFRLIVGYRIAPLAIMEKCGPARHASRAPPASLRDRASSTLDPHRSEPKVGSYRGDAEDCPSACDLTGISSRWVRPIDIKQFEEQHQRLLSIDMPLNGRGPTRRHRPAVSSPQPLGKRTDRTIIKALINSMNRQCDAVPKQDGLQLAKGPAGYPHRWSQPNLIKDVVQVATLIDRL